MRTQKRLSPGRTRVRMKDLNVDLLGRSFRAGAANVTVLKLCPANPRQVIIERDFDGKSWSVPAGLIRLILQRTQQPRTA